MTYTDAINHFEGSQKAMAKATGKSKQSISHYSKIGRIPNETQMILERVTGGELKADPMPWEQPNVQPQ